MKYFLDTEFHEYKKQPTVCGIKVGDPIDTIELISIGIVSETIITHKYPSGYYGGQQGREYYAICKDFDLKAAWENEWLRDSVLRSIWEEFQASEMAEFTNRVHKGIRAQYDSSEFNFKSLRYIINKYGKTRKQIAEEIIDFIYLKKERSSIRTRRSKDKYKIQVSIKDTLVEIKPEFYAYYADYDWVVFCWLFGRMIDLPKGFPMYCRDLKQEADRIWEATGKNTRFTSPKGEHNALADARWNKELYKFLKSI